MGAFMNRILKMAGYSGFVLVAGPTPKKGGELGYLMYVAASSSPSSV
jgi:hypothetical protein